MLQKLFFLLALVVLFAVNAPAQKIELPTQTPTALTAAQEEAVSQAVALRREQKYDESVARLEQVVKENPSSPVAFYALGLTYYAAKNYPQAVAAGLNAARFKSAILKDIYGLIGSSHDDAGNPQQALETYRFAIKQFPDDYLLRYNEGLTLYRQKNLKDARESLKRAAALNPKHSSSQLLLADIFLKGKYRVPALLAAMNFVLLEPNTRRTDFAADIALEVLNGSVKPGAKPNETTILFNPDSPTDEGDFNAAELILGIGKVAAAQDEKNKGKTEAQILASRLETVIAILEEPKKNNAGQWVQRQYLPFFLGLKRDKHIETLAHILQAKTGDAAARSWLAANSNKTLELGKWLDGFQLPAAK